MTEAASRRETTHVAELLAGAKRAVDHVAVGSAAQFRAHERSALARLDVLEVDDLEDRPVDLDVVAVLELVGAYRHVVSPRMGHSLDEV